MLRDDMKTIICTIAACAGLLHPFAAAHAKTTDLQRSSKWQMDYSKDACHLIANFGEGRNTVTAVLSRYEPADSLQLRIFGKQMGAFGQFFPGTTDFGPTENPRKVEIVVGKGKDAAMADYGNVRLDDWQPRMDGDIMPSISPQDEAKVDSLTITTPTGRTLRLLLGSMGSPMAAMRQCTRDLVKSWGYEPTVQSALRSPAMPATNPGTWLKSSDYPKAMAQGFENGIVRFRLDIDDKGAVSSCSVLDLAGKLDFGAATCSQIVKRAQFHPARDSAGAPIRSYFVSSVRWVMAH